MASLCVSKSEFQLRVSSLLHRVAWFVILVFGLPVGLWAQPQIERGRRLQVDDVLNLQQIGRGFGGPIAFSPDGRQLAFVIQRPQLTASFSVWPLLGNDRADIYLVSSAGGHPINITNGLTDQAGYWAPTWSPDGTRLAMLSTKGGNIHVWVWDRATQKLRRITNRGVDLYSVVDRPYLWVTSTTLLVAVLAAGEKTPQLLGAMRVAERASAAWAKMRNGKEVSVSVLSSGRKLDFETRLNHQLLAIDIKSGKSRVVSSNAARKILVSPDQRTIAFVTKVENYTFDPSKPLPYEDWEGKFDLEVTSVEGIQLLSHDRATSDVIPTSLRWSPDGRELAFLTYAGGKSTRPLLARFLTNHRTAVLIRDKGIDAFPGGREPPQLEWTDLGWLLYGSNSNQDSSTRRDWWLIQENEFARCITCSMRTAPSRLLPEVSHKSFVGVADGDVWRITNDAPPLNLTGNFNQQISSIIWPEQEWRPGKTEMPFSGATYQELIVAVKKDNEDELYRVDLKRDKLTLIPRPSPNAIVTGLSSASKTTLYSSYDADGLCMWLSPSETPTRRIFEGNVFLRKIKPGTQRMIEYRSTEGEILKGWVMLPPDYRPGVKYPLIVYVYPINYLRPFDNISDAIYLNLQIAASRGYAILSPTIPFIVEGAPDDPMLKLTSGVLPAIDKVIELGIAEPERLFLMGHSLGGFATYGLVTQTNRFKAAIALGGLSNLISGYGQFDTVSRYDDYPHEKSSNQALVIESVLSLRAPPWKDMDRYLRNSPIRYVNQVQTPLMIIQGDLDGIPIEQGEEFFMALQRQGKRAEFVRYWGEGHILQSPPNIRDMWQRIFAWFEEFSPKPEDKKPNEQERN